MKYKSVISAIFIERPNRFIAICDIDGEVVKAHVRNTGRCRELLIRGVKVYLEKSDQKRKQATHLLPLKKEIDLLI